MSTSEQPGASHGLLTFGWREWVTLPELNLPAIKAKVDTGARTSALHAFNVQPFSEAGRDRVEFLIHPKQLNNDVVATCRADVVDRRVVTDSGGHREERWVIESPVRIGAHEWRIELTLTARDDMRFRMLLGRNALKKRALVDSSRSYMVGKNPNRKTRKKVR